MDRERRQAPRSTLSELLQIKVGVQTARVVDLSTAGARVEHEEKLTVNSNADLEIKWGAFRSRFKARVARSEISGRKGGTLIYQSGLQFHDLDPEAAGLIAMILSGEPPEPPAVVEPEPAEPEPVEAIEMPAPPPAPPKPVAPSPVFGGGSLFLQLDDEDTMPYIMLRYRDSRWSKHYTATPQQPEDGLTISREQASEIDMLQRTYETADPETRRMMRIAMAAQLGG